MAFAAVAIGGGAAIGALGGFLSKGPDLSAAGQQANGYSQDSLNAYRNLVQSGPGAEDVGNATAASRSYAQSLNNASSTGLYNSTRGAQLAEQQFAPQRQALAQAMQDQISQANRAASSAGRSSNDPILRARLGAEAMRQTASLSAQQNSAAMDLGRQSTIDSLSLQGQQVNTLQGLSQQAFSNQGNLFNMSQTQLQSQLALRDSDKRNGGGGWLGALTGALAGAGAGAQMASGFGGAGGAAGAAGGAKVASASSSVGPSQIFGAASGVANNLTAPAPANQAYFNPSNFANAAYGQTPSSAPQFGPSSMSALSNAGMYRPGVSLLGPSSY
jgi:hypothetical protein